MYDSDKKKNVIASDQRERGNRKILHNTIIKFTGHNLFITKFIFQHIFQIIQKMRPLQNFKKAVFCEI
jgi:hypothetical protein